MKKIIAQFTRLFISAVTMFTIAFSSAQGRDTLNSNDYFIMTAPQVVLKSDFQNLVKTSIKNYKGNYRDSPGVIVVEFYYDNGKKEIWLDAMAYMYINDDERKILNHVFLQVAIVNDVIVLFKNEYSNTDQITPNENLSEFKLTYGNVINSCHQSFYAEKNKFLLKDSYCSFDLITE